MYPNIERRAGHAHTVRPGAAYVGWDSAGRLYYVARLGRKRSSWRAETAPHREYRVISGDTLREISVKLAKIGK